MTNNSKCINPLHNCSSTYSIDADSYIVYTSVPLTDGTFRDQYSAWADYFTTIIEFLSNSYNLTNPLPHLSKYRDFYLHKPADYTEQIIYRILLFTLYSSPPIDDNIVIFRAVNDHTFQKIMSSALLQGKVHLEKSFMNASLLDLPDWHPNDKYLLRMYVKGPFHAIYPNLFDNSGIPELILPPDTYIIPISVPYERNDYTCIDVQLNFSYPGPYCSDDQKHPFY